MCKFWFRCFKIRDFHNEGKECLGQPKTYKDEELEALLDKNTVKWKITFQNCSELSAQLSSRAFCAGNDLKAMKLGSV